jgi:superfamily II DNA or RNA helicase
MVTATNPGGIPLRPYQEEVIAAIKQAEMDQVSRPLVALPTGTGKTVIFSHFIAQRAGRHLVLAHRDELIQQTKDKLLLVNPDLQIGIIKARDNDLDAPVVLASVQTLSRRNRLEQLGQDFSTVTVDEGHHAVAETYRRVLDYLGVFSDAGPLTMGYTATPERADKVGLGQVWQKIVFQKSLLDMILAGYLADLRAVRVSLQVDLDKVGVRHGDFIESQLEGALLAASAPEHVVAAYQEHTPGRKALVFTPTVKVAYAMRDAFQEAGVAAEALDGTTPLETRRAILQRLHSGDTMVLANCAVLTEGYDEPSVDCIIVARPTKSKPLYIQMCGRGTRPYPGKEDCLIVDVVGVTARHSIMTAEEIFDLDLSKNSVLEAVAAKEAKERDRQTRIAEAPLPGKLVAADVNLFRSRFMKWVQAGAAWVLGLGNGFIRLSPADDGRFDIHVMGNGDRPTSLRAGLPLGYAQGFAEDFARNRGAGGLLNPRAHWRSEPATDKQNGWLRWKGLPVRPGLTKGEAVDIRTAYEAMLTGVN